MLDGWLNDFRYALLGGAALTGVYADRHLDAGGHAGD
jgi:hypothetical protein